MSSPHPWRVNAAMHGGAALTIPPRSSAVQAATVEILRTAAAPRNHRHYDCLSAEFHHCHRELRQPERFVVMRLMRERWAQRACWQCGVLGWCRHREPEVEYAELIAAGLEPTREAERGD